MGVVTSRDEGRDVAEAEAESCLHLALGTLFRFPMPFWKIIQLRKTLDEQRPAPPRQPSRHVSMLQEEEEEEEEEEEVVVEDGGEVLFLFHHHHHHDYFSHSRLGSRAGGRSACRARRWVRDVRTCACWMTIW